MSEITLNNILIRFPFEPYDVQKDYMSKVLDCLQKGQNGILESPTGTGKTLCLLCSSLAWLETQKAQHKSRLINFSESKEQSLSSLSKQLAAGVGNIWEKSHVVPKIIYSSRTHTQLSQAINELKRTSYSYMKNALLGSRDQMCIHPEVSKEENNTTKIHMCQIRVKSRNCYFHNQVEGKKDEPELKQILDIEDLVKIGKKKTFCPYYMTKELRQDADIIFMPYNYLLDPKSRKSHGIELQGNIVIFDEAHNVEKICEESASLQLRSTDIALCIDEVTQVMKKLQDFTSSDLGSVEGHSELPEDFSPEDLYILKTIFLELEKAVDEIPSPSDEAGVTYPGSFMFDLLEKADISFQKKGVIIDLLDKIILYLTTTSNSPFQRKGAGLQKFSDLIKTVFSKENFSLGYVEMVKQCYKVHIGNEVKKGANKTGWTAAKPNPISGKQGKVISYWCFSPGFGMKDLIEQGVQCVILTSGTLSPLNSFTSELQIPFPIQLENPHIIKPCQVWVGILHTGADGSELNSSYKTRGTPKYLSSLGQTILNFSRAIPGGLLVFFPSYPIMRSCQEHWQNTGTWERLSLIMPIFVEPQTKGGFSSVMEEFYQKVNDPSLKGACFMAVCRGKVSEGLDFANRNGRAVIITGLPFPPFKDPRVVLKQKYLDETRKTNKDGLSGQAWYRLEASRAVNQAIGRIIRHKEDYGAIILCDMRFDQFGFKKELSSWVQPFMKSFKSFGPALREIIQFFKVVQPMFLAPDSSGNKKRQGTISSFEQKSKVPSNAAALSSHLLRPAFSQVNRAQLSSATDESGSSACQDPILSYSFNSENRPSTSTALESDDHSFFGALEKKSSLLNFNGVASSYTSNSSSSHQPVLAPKKKKIKLISQSDKSLNDFLKSSLEQDSKIDKPLQINGSSDKSEENTRPEDKAQKIARYVKEVKTKLSKEEYARFSSSIKSYKDSQDWQTLIANMLSLFTLSNDRHVLLKKFPLFLRADHRGFFEERCKDFLK